MKRLLEGGMRDVADQLTLTRGLQVECNVQEAHNRLLQKKVSQMCPPARLSSACACRCLLSSTLFMQGGSSPGTARYVREM